MNKVYEKITLSLIEIRQGVNTTFSMLTPEQREKMRQTSTKPSELDNKEKDAEVADKKLTKDDK